MVGTFPQLSFVSSRAVWKLLGVESQCCRAKPEPWAPRPGEQQSEGGLPVGP